MSLEVSVELLDGSGAPVQGEVVFRQMETIAKGEASIVIVSGSTGVIADDGTYRVTERVLGRPAVQKYVQVVAADWASPPVAYELLPEVAFDVDCWDAHPAILSRYRSETKTNMELSSIRIQNGMLRASKKSKN